MLKQRVITAVVLLLILLPALFHPSKTPFVLASLVLIVAGAWEWARLSGYRQPGALVTGAVCACAGAIVWRLGALEHRYIILWAIVGACWVLAGCWVLYRGVTAWREQPRILRLVVGLLALGMAWLAIVQAKAIGINFLMSVLLLVWVADIFAYFSGRALGGRIWRRRLAPEISPGKSWEGVCGAMLGVVVMGFAWSWLDQTWMVSVPSLFSQLGEKGAGLLFLGALFLTMMSVVGDLFESLVKRSAGVKDSSALLPGHGGVLDRIDALLPTLPLAMMLYST